MDDVLLNKMFSKPLFTSSVLSCLINTPSIIISQNDFKWFCVVGLITSLLNHYVDDDSFYKIYVQYIDRFMMVVFAIVNFMYCQTEFQLQLLCIAISLFFVSKLTECEVYHLLSHGTLTILHFNML